jgi:hypothetical protein
MTALLNRFAMLGPSPSSVRLRRLKFANNKEKGKTNAVQLLQLVTNRGSDDWCVIGAGTI